VIPLSRETAQPANNNAADPQGKEIFLPCGFQQSAQKQYRKNLQNRESKNKSATNTCDISKNGL